MEISGARFRVAAVVALMMFAVRATRAAPMPAPNIACIVGADSTTYDGSPRRAAVTVCDALRHHGVRVGSPSEIPGAHSAAYVITVRRLGSVWALVIAYEDPIGTRLKEQRTSFRNLAEVEGVAAALAAAPYAKVAADHTVSAADSVPESAPPCHGVILDGWFGGSSAPVVDDHHAGSAALGFTALYRYEWLETGFGVTFGTRLLGANEARVTGLLGVGFNPAHWFQLDLLAEIGAEYFDRGNDLLVTTEEGGTATLVSFGGRVGASFLLHHSHQFVLGWWFAPSVTEQATVRSTIQVCLLGCDTTSDKFTVGGFSFATGLRLGGIIRIGD